MLKKLYVVCFCGFFLMSLSSVHAKPQYKWRLAETWPKDFPIFGDAVKRFVKNVEQLSGGRMVVVNETREKHQKPFGVFDLVREGDYQMGHSASFYWNKKDINTAFFTAIPMGMTSVEQYGWFYYGGGLDLMQKSYKKYGLMSFPGGNTGMQMGGWFNKEINSIEDMQGLKMRIPGLGGQILSELGVDTVNIPPDELLNALKTGKLDALEWVGPSMDVGMGFPSAAKYYYTGWHEPGTELQFLVNIKAYNKLPKDLREILIVSMRLAAFDTYIQAYHENGVQLSNILRDYKDVEIRSFPPRVINKITEKAIEILDRLEKSSTDPLTTEIVASIKSYKKQIRLWTRFSDMAYLNNTPGF